MELRIDAQELETSLGGAYSLLAQTFQAPLAVLYLRRVKFPLSGDTVIPVITTGLEAFGKAGELDKIKQFTEMMQMPTAWPEDIQRRTKFDIYAREVAAGLSMKMPWMMSSEEYAAKQKSEQSAQQNQMMQEAAVGAAPEIIKQQMGGQNGSTAS